MKPTPEQLQKLRENVKEFIRACGMALKVNKFMCSDKDPFHRELSNGFEKLCDELYPYVGAVTGAFGVMGTQRAFQVTKPRGTSLTVPPSTPTRGDVPVVNGNLIPSLRRDGRRGRRTKGGSMGGSSAIAGNAGGSSANSARGNGRVHKSETFSTISLSLARKRADESVDGDPNSSSTSLTGIGASTPGSTTRSTKKIPNKGLNVLSPIPPPPPPASFGTPMASSASAEGSFNCSATPLKIRVPVPQHSSDDNENESSISSIDSDSDEDADIVDISEGDAEPEANENNESKKSHRHRLHRRH